MSERELVFYASDGTQFLPNLSFNGAAAGSSYHVHRTGRAQKTSEGERVSSIAELARLVLVDGWAARLQSQDRKQKGYFRFASGQMERYELDERVAAQLGIPARNTVASAADSQGLTALRAAFLNRFPDFVSVGAFAATTGTFHQSFRLRVDALLAAVATHPEDGWAVLRDILTASQGGRGALPPFFEGDVNWRVPRARDGDPTTFDAALNALVADEDDPAAALAQFNATFWPALQAIAGPNTFRDTRIVPSAVLAAAHPDRAILVRYTPYVKAERLLNDRTLFRNAAITADEYRAVLALAEQIRAAMIDWGWQPRDLWDVHGFILATCGNTTETEMDDAAVLARFSGSELFRAVQKKWTSQQTAAFCDIARTGHEIGLDWYFTNMPHEPVRLGRKPDRDRRARATIGYLNDRTTPRMWLSDKPGRPQMGRNDFPLDNEAARAFADAFSAHKDAISAWEAPSPSRPGRWPDEAGLDAPVEEKERLSEKGESVNPTNLILYGPPGTGKTYATAARAVQLCGEQTDGLDRDALMARFKALNEAGRIEFVTFHQSTAYEEFVEGLRPVQAAEGAAGFELQPTPGLFRRIARRAETSTGSGEATFTIGNRQVFKMSIGEAANPDDDHLFEDAIVGGYTVLGFSDIDWSNERFADRQEIIDAIHQEDGNADADASSGRVQMPHIFRNWMKPGDLIIVSKGNGLFRAIGEIVGDYAYAPREGGGYAHRRSVAWLWVDRAGVPVNEIYARRFSMRSAYQLTPDDLNIPALERYIASQQDAGSGAPEPFVLVIDEINRANISKVFGELITLLEADKRIGAANELRVRLPYSGDSFGVPANLHIVGTMNTADRSIALLDTALRRRFTFEELMPDPTLLKTVEGIDLETLLTTLNDRIEYLFDREHQIGHAYFLPCRSAGDVHDVMRHKVIPLLQEYFYEDWTKVAAVLGDVFEDDGKEREGGFLIRTPLASPFGRDEEEGRTRYRWTVREPATFRYAGLGG